MAFKRTKRTYKKRPSYKKKTYKKKPTTLRKLVRKELKRTAEKKTFNFADLTHDILPSNHASVASQVFPISPYGGYLDIQQGVSQSGRIGNRIQITNLTLKGSICALPYHATTNIIPLPVQIQMFVFYDKEFPTMLPNPYVANDFFQLGGASAGFRNDLVDLWCPVNTDRYTVVARKSWKVGYASNDGTGSAVGNAFFANNDFKMNVNFSLNLTKHAIKTVRYEDNNSDPTSRGLFVMFNAISSTGGQMNSSTVPAVLQFSADVTYTDV